VITPRRTRLIRAADLHEFRAAIRAITSGGHAVVVPTRAAAVQLGKSFSDDTRPLLITRDQLYDLLHSRLEPSPPRLNAFDREAIAQAAADDAARDAGTLPFQIRPGLVSEMLRFYDQLRWQSQNLDRFDELITAALVGDSTADRGADRLLAETRFLVAAFREYERRVAASGACDEHLLRERLLSNPGVATLPTGLKHVVVTVADWIADPSGLFVADFDLLARLPGLGTLDLVCTSGVLASGFHERIHNWWPGLEEVEARELVEGPTRVRPVLALPTSDPDLVWFTHRDREEELVAVAERLRSNGANAQPAFGRTAIVFKQPLPYIYLAPDTLGAAGIPYQIVDRLPLAAEPVAATVDLVLDAVETAFSRESLVALLKSPHFDFQVRLQQDTASEADSFRRSISELNHQLSDSRYLGGLDRLEGFAILPRAQKARTAADALKVALAVARELAPLASSRPASEQLRGLFDFLQRHFRPLEPDGEFTTREQLGRDALLEILHRIAAARERHHDAPWTIDDLASAVRRWIAEQTFQVADAADGVHLLDDQAARYGDFDDMTIVGLIEHEWPERPRRNIFYPPALLKSLGWPTEKDRRAADDARFLDLLASPSRDIALSAFTLDDEVLVTRSILLDEVGRARLSAVQRSTSMENVASANGERDWARLRAGRSSSDLDIFHGAAGSRLEASWSVSALETYTTCPFKFFAQHILKLEEEPDDEEVMDPRRQGQFVHKVFETFFREWQASGHRSITATNLDQARAMFTEVVDRALADLPEGEAGLERTRLLGSSAAAGLGEAVFRMEAERPVPVIERLLEHELRGSFTISTASGPREVQLRGKADRVDLLDDGTFRLIDYKLGWPPDRTRALQLPVYSVCAEQKLANRHGRQWRLGEAMYLAFKGPKRVVPLFASSANRDEVLDKAQQRLADTIDAISRGEFPPTPNDVFQCESCSFAAVCRKDYVGDV
jgi:RecB family exonuclease